MRTLVLSMQKVWELLVKKAFVKTASILNRLKKKDPPKKHHQLLQLLHKTPDHNQKYFLHNRENRFHSSPWSLEFMSLLWTNEQNAMKKSSGPLLGGDLSAYGDAARPARTGQTGLTGSKDRSTVYLCYQLPPALVRAVTITNISWRDTWQIIAINNLCFFWHWTLWIKTDVCLLGFVMKNCTGQIWQLTKIYKDNTNIFTNVVLFNKKKRLIYKLTAQVSKLVDVLFLLNIWQCMNIFKRINDYDYAKIMGIIITNCDYLLWPVIHRNTMTQGMMLWWQA